MLYLESRRNPARCAPNSFDPEDKMTRQCAQQELDCLLPTMAALCMTIQRVRSSVRLHLRGGADSPKSPRLRRTAGGCCCCPARSPHSGPPDRPPCRTARSLMPCVGYDVHRSHLALRYPSGLCCSCCGTLTSPQATGNQSSAAAWMFQTRYHPSSGTWDSTLGISSGILAACGERSPPRT